MGTIWNRLTALRFTSTCITLVLASLHVVFLKFNSKFEIHYSCKMTDGDYFLDAAAREEELRKINEELDAKLILAENSVSSKDAQVTVDWAKNMDFHSQDDAHDDRRSYKSRREAHTTEQQYLTNDDGDVGKLKNDTKVRLQMSKLNALSSQLEEASKMKQEKETTVAMLMTKMKKMKSENQRLQKELKRANAKESGKRVTEERRKIDLENFTIENQTLKKEISGLKTIVKESDAKSRSNEVRLTRALESVDKFKRLLSDGKNVKSESDSKLRAKVDDIQKQLKDVEKERNNLLLCFKEQMKLIEVLKRQKVHAEASKLLDITEKEFLKVIEWDSPTSQTSPTPSHNKQEPPVTCKS